MSHVGKKTKQKKKQEITPHTVQSIDNLQIN